VPSPIIFPADPGFAAEVERVRASGVLGRATQLQRLFDFLVDCQASGRVPKELEVAVDGFGRGAEFDVGQDSTVRVIAHKLRRRLEDFYRELTPAANLRLTLPRGEYRLQLEAAPAVAATPDDGNSGMTGWRRLLPASARERGAAVLVLCLLAACAALLFALLRQPAVDPRLASLRASVVWGPLMRDQLPIQLVLGDYYIFGERDGGDGIRRLIRDFDINSRQDLERRFGTDSAQAKQYADLALGYLPTSSAQALREILPVVMTSGKQVTLTLASELDPSSIKTTHVVYVGYLSALGMLQDMVFAQSRYSFGASYDELIDAENGKAWTSDAGKPHADSERYLDYAYVASFAGPAGIRHLVISGTRDVGLMQAAETAAEFAALNKQVDSGHGFEALIEVQGVNGVNVESHLVDTSVNGS
jgi:hypothetical protein